MMQKECTALFLVMTLGLAVQGQSLQVRSAMKEATIFYNGAQIIREASLRVPAGINELVFTQLPHDIDPTGIQVKATGQLTILSVNFRRNFLDSPELSHQVRMLEDSLMFYKNRLDLNRAMLKVYEDEEALLAANRSLGGKDRGVQVAELRAAADFHRQRLQEIKTNWLKVKQAVERDEERHKRIGHQLGQLHGRVTNKVGEILVMVSASAPATSTFTIGYSVVNAGWKPVYDIRVADIDSPLEIMLKASAFQNTGEDWSNARLTFSTGNPRQFGIKPVLLPWFLQFDQETVITLRGGFQKSMEMATDQANISIRELQTPVVAQSTADFVQVFEARTSRKFIVTTPHNLPSGGEMRLVELERNSLPALFEYFVVPKINTDVFLVARVAQWQELGLLAGEANLFFEGTYMGKTFIDPAITADTLELSLGNDPNIVVRRERIKDLTRQSLLGNRVTETVGWSINARNNKRSAVTLNIQDQLPVSTQHDMDVTAEEISGASFDRERGFVTWRLELKPAEAQQRIMRYLVRYPKNKRITLE